jgi:hypothetical protein
MPQFAGSLAVSTHAPEHSMYGFVHTKSHCPPAQTGLALTTGGQTLPHSPQLLVSLPVFTQEPLQSVSAPPQVVPH